MADLSAEEILEALYTQRRKAQGRGPGVTLVRVELSPEDKATLEREYGRQMAEARGAVPVRSMDWSEADRLLGLPLRVVPGKEAPEVVVATLRPGWMEEDPRF